MANAIELITKYSSKAWDKVYKAESRSALLDADKDLLKFVGVKTVKIAKFSSTGLSDYRRANLANNVDPALTGNYDFVAGAAQNFKDGYGYGYDQGDAALTWEEFTISCDRAAQYRIELFDDEETDGLAVAATTTEVSRTQVVPEVDAYCFSKVAEYAGNVVSEKIVGGTPGANEISPLAALNAGFKKLDDEEIPAEDQIIFCSTNFWNCLRSTPELYRRLDQAEYDKDVKFTISEYEGRKLTVVPPRRFKTLINLLRGGYGFKTGSKDINFIICAKSAIYHVTKYDKVRVFSPSVVQDFDGYKVNIRVYHDVFVPDNKRVAIYCSLDSTAAGADANLPGATSLNFNYVDGRLVNVAVTPGDMLVSKFYASYNQPGSTEHAVVNGTTSIATFDASAIEVKPYTVISSKLTGTHSWYLLAVNEDGIIVAYNETAFTTTTA